MESSSCQEVISYVELKYTSMSDSWFAQVMADATCRTDVPQGMGRVVCVCVCVCIEKQVAFRIRQT